MHSTILATLGGLLAITASALPLAKRSFSGPVVRQLPIVEVKSQANDDQINSDFPDPSIVPLDGTWYAFGTQSIYDNTNIKVQLATSTDFNSWELRQGYDALGSLPSWADSGNPQVWAPDVIQVDDGSFVLYFSAASASNTALHCFGTATSQNVEGPYTPTSDTPFACPLDQGGAIDPSGFRDANGQRYVVYKIDGNSIGNGGACGNGVPPEVSTPIMIQKVQEDGITQIDGPTQILDRDAADGPLVEAPAMVRAPGGTYVLFFSSGCYTDDSYDTSYATSDSPTGPFTKSSSPLLVTGTNGVFGPGGTDAAWDASHIAFHAYSSQEDVGNRRYMYTSTISWNSGSKVYSLS